MRKAKKLTKRIKKAFELESSILPVPPPRKSLSSTELRSSQRSSHEDVSIESDESDSARSSRSSTKSETALALENENLQEQLSLMMIKLTEKDKLIHELDAKNRSLDEQLREGESTMRLWINQLKNEILTLKDDNKKKETALLAYQEQNMLLNEEILELNGRRKCEVMQASFHASQNHRKYSEASDSSLLESFLIEDDEEQNTSVDEDSEFVLVADQEAPDTETCVWEETVSGIKNNRNWPNNNNVKLLIRQGVPPRFRPRIWRALMNDQIVLRLGLYSSLANEPPHEDVVKQIALDLPRTKRWLLNDYSPQFREKLRRVLWAFANYNKEIGYCQGLNRIACLALEHLYEEDAFYFLRLVTESFLPQDYYSGNMCGIRADGALISEILRDKAPRLSEHLRSLDPHVDTVATVATNWLLIIFIDPSIDITVTLKIWDAFLFEGNKVLIRWCIAIFLYHEDKLLKCCDSSQVMQTLRSNKLLEPKDFDRIQNYAYNRINPFSKNLSFFFLIKSTIHEKTSCDAFLEQQCNSMNPLANLSAGNKKSELDPIKTKRQSKTSKFRYQKRHKPTSKTTVRYEDELRKLRL
ncbi:Oidioi.mRNA.OKI2018_I69.PAR.g11464.t1.cds [Oikopleura dioica]|uniref:Oidioi.mRNA.OKI2018_I69.PAR.g11464.t1.cds n=1 Tax=Oikopleura dioica TaxID=34765 RepID=A0ABN7RZ53_OIKDI|nr:Oidioi.mRNA.OKI2018_I69.PAR.g11464.t1.cds [Oikopleura dioica]